MPKKTLYLIISYWLLVCSCFLIFVSSSYATTDPLAVPNNKFGVHILFPSEIADAAKFVNASGGDWGYVVVPLQDTDYDLVKWQTFMDNARKLHVVPIIRIATEGDYFNTVSWRKPTDYDVVDAANFLDSLSWPTKNRYVVIYNEPNDGAEWGGTPDPASYAQILSYGVTVFKSRSSDFFVISAGLDNAASNTDTAMNEYTFLQQMNTAVPGIFSQIDGLGSHSYPNPGFSQPASRTTQESINSFAYEKSLVQSFGAKQNLPVFITETGWSTKEVSQNFAGAQFKTAYQTVWNDPSIVAVAPFLLKANGSFTDFTLLDQNNQPNAIYNSIVSLPKTKGTPLLTSTSVLGAETVNTTQVPKKDYTHAVLPSPQATRKPAIMLMLSWLFRI